VIQQADSRRPAVQLLHSLEVRAVQHMLQKCYDLRLQQPSNSHGALGVGGEQGLLGSGQGGCHH
jgi:hypothetical protein